MILRTGVSAAHTEDDLSVASAPVCGEGDPYSGVSPTVRMRKSDSAWGLARTVFASTARAGKEQLVATDGETWQAFSTTNTSVKLEVPVLALLDYIASSPQQRVAVYHSHTTRYREGTPVPCVQGPSYSDFKGHVRLTQMASERGKTIVSRVVDDYGVWEYDIDTIERAQVYPVNAVVTGLARRFQNLPPQEQAGPICNALQEIHASVTFRPLLLTECSAWQMTRRKRGP